MFRSSKLAQEAHLFAQKRPHVPPVGARVVGKNATIGALVAHARAC